MLFRSSEVDWKDKAFEATVKTIYTGENAKAWSPEKVALTLKLQKAWPEFAWKEIFAPTFKYTPLLHTGNYAALSRIMKVSLVCGSTRKFRLAAQIPSVFLI